MLDFLQDNLRKVQDDIRETCAKYSRNIDEITLCAVSKTKPIEYINAINSLGLNVFGENYVQEICGKFLSENRNFYLHLIGHLQSNKISKVLPFIDSIDSVDSYSLLLKIDKAAEKLGKKIDVMLEYNTSGDESKTGFRSESEFKKTLDAFYLLKNVHFTGMMTMGPLGGNESDIRKSFEKFNLIFDTAKSEYKDLDFSIKSFGMSRDYRIALEMSSNFLRIGTAIFGKR